MFIERQLADILRSDISIELVRITPMEFSHSHILVEGEQELHES